MWIPSWREASAIFAHEFSSDPVFGQILVQRNTISVGIPFGGRSLLDKHILQKPTFCLCSRPFVAVSLEKKYTGDHRHVPIRGQTMRATGQRMSLSSLAGGYSLGFVNAVL